MLRLWNRFILMPNNRMVKKIFIWDKTFCNNNWNSELKSIMEKIGMTEDYNNTRLVDLKIAEKILRLKAANDWKNELPTKPKLRTYITFKENYGTEDFARCCHDRLQRSLIAQIRSGTLPLNIEVGRFRNIQLEDRICTLCNNNMLEDEFHFVCQCRLYDDIRSNLYDTIQLKNTEFHTLEPRQKFDHILKNEWNLLGKFLKIAWERRTRKLYD